MNYQELEKLVLKWANDKGILDKGNPLAQLSKTKEEIQEIEECLLHFNKGNEEFIDSKGRLNNTFTSMKMEIGDSIVTQIILCKLLNISFVECLEMAYNKIKERKGYMKDGVFIKK